MEFTVIAIFILGYAAITLEHVIAVNKTATALIMAVACWTVYAVGSGQQVAAALSHHLEQTAQIIFFLIGAMTIVELIDSWQGFNIITHRITTQNPKTLLWTIAIFTFFLSAVLDNLTTSIVMVSMVRKIVPDRKMRMLFAGTIIIAANAGGAWSPIGDVTTTMLWIGGQISSAAIIKTLFFPSVISLLVPLIFLSFKIGNEPIAKNDHAVIPSPRGSGFMLVAGLIVFMLVPVFKIVTHLPPYAGILLGLGVLWVCSELIDPKVDNGKHKPLSAGAALSRIDTSSALFFLGILLAVGALESMGFLTQLAQFLSTSVGDNRIIVALIGISSAIVDNVPLIAASTGMYSLDAYPMDDRLWEFLAYCTGTGGSILIIGSAAGVAVMGMENIDFSWYLKRISGLALLGYLAGAAAFLLIVW